MNVPRASRPDPVRPPAGDVPPDALLEYLASTAVRPTPDLATRIQARLEREPDRTPPRRYLLALLRLRPSLALGAFRQLVRVANGSGRFPAVVRAQAFGLVLATLFATVAVGIGSVAGVQRLLDDRTDHVLPAPILPSPTERADRSVPPSLEPSASPAPVSPSPAARPTDRPDPTARPTRTPEDEGPDAATARPTARPTRRPRATERSESTPRPTQRPRRTERPERPEPTETPETEGGDDHGDDGHEESDGDQETEPPDDTGMRLPLVI